MIHVPPDGPMFEVITMQEAIRVLCRHRPKEFRLFVDTFPDGTILGGPSVLRLQYDRGSGFKSSGTWIHPETNGILALDAWDLCEPVACMLFGLGLGFMSGADLSNPVGQRHWWMVQLSGQMPISRKAPSSSEAAVMVYAELIRQRLAS